jgi:hypothetical protein
MDTLCKPLNAVEIDWSKSMASEKPIRYHQPTIDSLSAQASTLSEEEAIWDWQLVSLILAFAACLMFFVGTALISINYIRQWRKIKKQFDTGKLDFSSLIFLSELLTNILKEIKEFLMNSGEPLHLIETMNILFEDERNLVVNRKTKQNNKFNFGKSRKIIGNSFRFN